MIPERDGKTDGRNPVQTRSYGTRFDIIFQAGKGSAKTGRFQINFRVRATPIHLRSPLPARADLVAITAPRGADPRPLTDYNFPLTK